MGCGDKEEVGEGEEGGIGISDFRGCDVISFLVRNQANEMVVN